MSLPLAGLLVFVSQDIHVSDALRNGGRRCGSLAFDQNLAGFE